MKPAKSQTRTYAKQPTLAFALAHKSHTFGEAPWPGSQSAKLLLVPQNGVAYVGRLERATLYSLDQFELACVSSPANLVSSLEEHGWRPLPLFDWLKWVVVSHQEVIASSMDSLLPCLPCKE